MAVIQILEERMDNTRRWLKFRKRKSRPAFSSSGLHATMDGMDIQDDNVAFQQRSGINGSQYSLHEEDRRPAKKSRSLLDTFSKLQVAGEKEDDDDIIQIEPTVDIKTSSKPWEKPVAPSSIDELSRKYYERYSNYPATDAQSQAIVVFNPSKRVLNWSQEKLKRRMELSEDSSSLVVKKKPHMAGEVSHGLWFNNADNSLQTELPSNTSPSGNIVEDCQMDID